MSEPKQSWKSLSFTLAKAAKKNFLLFAVWTASKNWHGVLCLLSRQRMSVLKDASPAWLSWSSCSGSYGLCRSGSSFYLAQPGSACTAHRYKQEGHGTVHHVVLSWGRHECLQPSSPSRGAHRGGGVGLAALGAGDDGLSNAGLGWLKQIVVVDVCKNHPLFY